MSDQPYKPPIGTHYPTQWEKDYVKLHQENAALRQQVERLERERDEARADCEVKASYARIYAANFEQAEGRAQAAEAANERLVREKRAYWDSAEKEIESLRCTIAALREGLEKMWKVISSDALYTAPIFTEEEYEKLKGPNPGARVEKVLEAVRQFVGKRDIATVSGSNYDQLVQAVRALDKREDK